MTPTDRISGVCLALNVIMMIAIGVTPALVGVQHRKMHGKMLTVTTRGIIKTSEAFVRKIIIQLTGVNSIGISI